MSAPQKNQNAAKPEEEKLSGEDSRHLNIRVLKSEFGAWKYAWDKLGKSQSDFVREALREKVSSFAKQRISEGKTIPLFIVDFLKEKQAAHWRSKLS